jgi:hypothetical protein
VATKSLGLLHIISRRFFSFNIMIATLRSRNFHSVSRKPSVLRIRIRDPEDFWPLDPGSVSGMNNPDHISESLETIFFGSKLLNSFMQIRDGKNTNPGSATLETIIKTSRSPQGDVQLMKEIDLFLNEEERESMDSEAHLKRMLELSDKAAQIHHPVAKKKVGVANITKESSSVPDPCL